MELLPAELAVADCIIRTQKAEPDPALQKAFLLIERRTADGVPILRSAQPRTDIQNFILAPQRVVLIQFR